MDTYKCRACGDPIGERLSPEQQVRLMQFKLALLREVDR
jgi:hypothetical protein